METNTPEKLLEALELEEENFDTYAEEIGGTPADKLEISRDRANLAQAIANHALAEADKKVATQIKYAVYGGDSKESVPVYPAFQLAPLPFPDVKAGAESRYQERKRRAKAAKGYTKGIGIAMGYEAPKIDPVSPDSLAGALKPADMGGYQYKAEFKKQGQSGMHIEHRVRGTEIFTTKINALQSPVIIDVEETPASVGAVIQLEIRCRLLDGNEQVGQWSPTYTLTVSP